MTSDESKATVRDFFARLSAGDIDGTLAAMTDDATWWIAGQKHLPNGGLYTKEKIGRLFHRMFAALEPGFTMTVVESIAEGDVVAAEVSSSGDLKNGRRYRQQYHMRIQLRDGRVASVREYLDTQHAYEVWMAPA